MRHRVGGRKFGLPSDQRRALLKSLMRALLSHDSIQTTETRAKDVKILVERCITTAKGGDVHARRQIRRALNDETLVKRVVDEVAPKFKERNGGYTRITRLGPRRGDSAMMVKLELVD
ncbi:MAG: 50S ribosomal protein L17 [Armatimonadetes bacterium]|nr:50S ribosomal protein L17 [Armatimonadota bacterium]